jgi:hypothetical protein
MKGKSKNRFAMAGVKECESRLCEAAKAYSRDSGNLKELLRAAIAYSRAKKKSADARDKWKQRKRLGE